MAPRNVRNFWLEIQIDGRKTRIACGPQKKDGGFSICILQRDKGQIATGAYVEGRAGPDGDLVLAADGKDCGFVKLRETKR